MTTLAGAPTPLRQCVELAGKDLRAEARAGEALLVTVPFGAIGLLLVPLAVGTDTPLLREIGPGLYWVVVLLFGVLVTL
nr:heme exporter protein CcmB [Actinomycetota bacterium]